MTMETLLRQYRWCLRERESLQRELDDLDSPWWTRPDPRGAARVTAATSVPTNFQVSCLAGVVPIQ